MHLLSLQRFGNNAVLLQRANLWVGTHDANILPMSLMYTIDITVHEGFHLQTREMKIMHMKSGPLASSHV